MQADQVMASIVMFSFVYLGLFAVWVYVLHSKIQHGPAPLVTSPAGGGTQAARGAGQGALSFVETAGQRISHAAHTSLTATDARSGSAAEPEPDADSLDEDRPMRGGA